MKEVIDVTKKFFETYEDAEADYNFSFQPVPTEGGISPNECTAICEVNPHGEFIKFIKDESELIASNFIGGAICKLKIMKRETLFGTLYESVYVLNSILG